MKIGMLKTVLRESLTVRELKMERREPSTLDIANTETVTGLLP